MTIRAQKVLRPKIGRIYDHKKTCSSCFSFNDDIKYTTSIIKIFAGKKPTSGYELHVHDIKIDSAKNVTVYVYETEPAKDGQIEEGEFYPAIVIYLKPLILPINPNPDGKGRKIRVVDADGKEYPWYTL